ncbi:MATE family efflux transporter [uncultured Thomasclavelia sp.]|uniref:MATE family efflux transporter n=1 Tax=uncultured Thomasclavelia sp. TaxID=3025759 RepID=UPI002636963F|nr:MATE family efflux transporter [uncultured Thomasclavelia sp.]
MNSELSKRELFETVPVKKAVATLAVPTIISQIVTIIYNLADTFFVGQLSNPYMVAAVTVVSPWFNLLTALGNLFGIGGSSLISRLLGASSNNIQYAQSYLFWTVILGGIPTTLAMTMAHLLRGEGKAKFASIGMMLGGILNIILDPLFIFGLGLGFSGAAIATATSNLVSTLFFIYIFYRVKKQTTMSLNISYFNTSYLKPVLSVGIASALTTLLANVSNMVIISLASGYGDIPVAAYGIVKRIDMFPLNISFGLCQGIMPLVGSGKKATLLLLPPQRTVRESFPSYGSSFYKVLSFLKTRLNSSKVFLNNKGVLNNYYFQFF